MIKKKKRVDVLLVEKGLAESRQKAKDLIKKGAVFVEDKRVIKPSKEILSSSKVNLLEKVKYVGRGGYKLEEALKQFSISPKEKVAADIGSSTGGFTDCLLQNGASKVYSIDIGKNQLNPKLKEDKRVIYLEGTDVRKLEFLPDLVDLCCVDVTFASIKSILPNVKNWLKKEGDIIVLLKPQFEVGLGRRRYKVIKDFEIHKEVIEDIKKWCMKNNFDFLKFIKSPILGRSGEKEFLLHLKLK